MRRIILLVAVFLIFTTLGLAKDRVPIFKDFCFGDSKENIKKKINVSDCGKSSDGFDILCCDEYEFLSNKWRINFAFDKNNLSIIYLTGKVEQERFLTVVQSLSKDFAVVAIHGDNGMFDMVSAFRQKGNAEAIDMMNKFERASASGSQITYTFFEKKTVEPIVNHAQNITDLVKMCPETLREVDVEIFSLRNEINIRFFVPIAALKSAMESAPVVEEKF